MTKCRFILMNKGVCEYDVIINDVKKPLINESITMESDDEFRTYEVTFIQHTFDKNGVFKYVMVTGIKKN